MTDHPNLTISLRDLGPIAYAALELRPLTVLVGPSGSGKTFAASTIYSFAEAGARLVKNLDSPYSAVVHDGQLAQVVEQLASLPGADWIERLLEGQRPSPPDFGARFGEFMASAAGLAGPHLAGVVAGNLGSLLVSRSKSDFDRVGSSRSFGVALHKEQLASEGVHPGVSIQAPFLAPDPNLPVETMLKWLSTWRERQRAPEAGETSLDRKAAAVFALLAFAAALQSRFGDRPLYLPTGRTSLLSTAPLVAFAQAQATSNLRLAGPLSRFFPTYFEAGAASDGELETLAIELDHLLHGGRIVATTSLGSVPELRFEKDGFSVPMERASSSVSELAAVTYFIRKLARKNSLIVLEEPEAHLHPAKQVLLARALARIIHAGLRVVVTTHSDVLVDALGWLLRSNARDDQFRADLPEQERLQVDQVGVYRFRHDAELGGFTADPVPYDPDDGFDRREFLDISADLFNRHADLTDARAISGEP